MGGGRWLWAASCTFEGPLTAASGPGGSLGPDFWRTLIWMGWVGGSMAQLDAREITGSGEKGLTFPLIPKATHPILSSPTLGQGDHRSIGSVTGKMWPQAIPKGPQKKLKAMHHFPG